MMRILPFFGEQEAYIDHCFSLHWPFLAYKDHFQTRFQKPPPLPFRATIFQSFIYDVNDRFTSSIF